jgi:hypothetical protein
MKFILLLFVLTIGLTLILKFKVAPEFGPDVGARFLERSKYIPSHSTALSRETFANVPVWIWWVLPTAYVIADLAEDTVAAAILKMALPLTNGTYLLLRSLTSMKLATVSVAIGQVGFLAALGGLLRLFPPAP